LLHFEITWKNKMTPMNDTSPSDQDDRLAAFTDRVLKGQHKGTESITDEELRGLEETILRLQQAIPPASLDEAAIKQMQVRLNARIRREGGSRRPSFWKNWFGAGWRSGLPRPQYGMAFAAVAMIVVLLLLVPSWLTGGTPTTATALTPSQNITVVLGLAGVIFLIFWVSRRK
jgi:hypothetical protein